MISESLFIFEALAALDPTLSDDASSLVNQHPASV